MTNKWTLEVQEDPETGDSVLTLPPELLEQVGWKEGDTINIKVEDGAMVLSKVNG